MAFLTVFYIPGKYEWALWLPIFLICAYVVASQCSGKFFLSGFIIGIFNCCWVTPVHIIFKDDYLKLNPDMVEMMKTMPLASNPLAQQLFIGSLAGIISGIVLGLFCWIAAKIMKKA